MMSRIAILVDAGYLFAQGSTALTGSKKTRNELSLNETAVMSELTNVAKAKSADSKLLRIYWYDGVAGYKGPSLEQINIAHLDNVKLRLGFVNSQGQQKGVDSLIVTDLIELARNNAITDAVLLSGDEDVRIGVQVAQNFGVRIHLIGIAPSRGSQSKQLLQEADTTTEWSKGEIEKFLDHNPKVSVKDNVKQKSKAASAIDCDAEIKRTVEEYVSRFETTDGNKLQAHFKTEYVVPPEYDRVMLGKCRDALERTLVEAELRHMRECFRNSFKTK